MLISLYRIALGMLATLDVLCRQEGAGERTSDRNSGAGGGREGGRVNRGCEREEGRPRETGLRGMFTGRA